MVACARMFGLLIVASMALAEGAVAQSVADTVRKWGLVGTWALDCSKPASGTNGYLAYVIRGGRVAHERDFGNRRDSNDVQQARTVAGGALELVVHFPTLNQTRKYILMKGADGRTRALANSRIDGTDQTIKGGKFNGNGNTTPWQSRCR